MTNISEIAKGLSDGGLYKIPHPSEFIMDELFARGWTREDLAMKMRPRSYGLNKLAIDLYFDVGPEKTNMRIGETMGQAVADALDVSLDFLINLENAWLYSKGLKPSNDT